MKKIIENWLFGGIVVFLIILVISIFLAGICYVIFTPPIPVQKT